MKGIRTSILLVLFAVIFIKNYSIAFGFSDQNILKASNILPASVNGRIVVVSVNNLTFSVLLQLNTNVGNEAMGGATMVIGFDTSTISYKANPVKNIDYVFHNFCDGNYSPASVTRPMDNKIWVNIDLPFVHNNNGTILASGDNWTDVVTINFDVKDAQGFTSVYWLTNSVFWGIYDDDNNSFWNNGQFQDLLDTPLPVELSLFTTKIIGDEAQLNWETKTEVNNYGFDIERRVNENDWQKIGFVDGHGNSNSPNYYSFFDTHLTGGSRFSYRLKQIDTDGNYQFSEIVVVEYIPQNFALYQNYPNPFNPNTKISWQSPVTSRPIIKVYDILGNEVATLVDEFKPAGIFEVEFIAANLAGGVYFYQLKVKGFVETKKMILMK
jgi:hypothetical protein